MWFTFRFPLIDFNYSCKFNDTLRVMWTAFMLCRYNTSCSVQMSCICPFPIPLCEIINQVIDKLPLGCRLYWSIDRNWSICLLQGSSIQPNRIGTIACRALGVESHKCWPVWSEGYLMLVPMYVSLTLAYHRLVNRSSDEQLLVRI